MRRPTLVPIVLLSGCTYQAATDVCDFPFAVLYESAPSSFTVSIVSPHYSEATPFLSFHGPDGEPALIVSLIEDRQLRESSADRCRNAELRRYRLSVGEEDWIDYWAKAVESGRFSGGVGVPGLESPVRTRSFGFALIDESSGRPAWVCGCLAR